MARILSQAAIRDSRPLIRDHTLPSHVLPRRSQPLSSRFLSRRWRSGRSDKHAQIFEVVVETASEGGGVDVEVSSSEAAVRRLEDVIHGILARRAAPDWLPFVPGSSYWVPPRGRSYRLVDVVRRAASPMTDEEVMSLTTVKGWPCAAHLLGGLMLGTMRSTIGMQFLFTPVVTTVKIKSFYSIGLAGWMNRDVSLSEGKEKRKLRIRDVLGGNRDLGKLVVRKEGGGARDSLVAMRRRKEAADGRAKESSRRGSRASVAHISFARGESSIGKPHMPQDIPVFGSLGNRPMKVSALSSDFPSLVSISAEGCMLFILGVELAVLDSTSLIKGPQIQTRYPTKRAHNLRKIHDSTKLQRGGMQ